MAEVPPLRIEPAFLKQLSKQSSYAARLLTHHWYPRKYKSGAIERSIPLPPSCCEQRAIATALSDADALIESLDRLIAKKRAIKQAAMQQLLTGQTRLPGFTGEWETKRLGELLIVI